MVLTMTMTMTLDQDHGQRNDATVWKYETQWPSMTVVYAKQLPAVDIGAGPISEEGNPGKANGHSSLHTQSQHNSSSVNFNLLSSLPVNTTNFQVSLRKKKTIEVAKFTKARKQQNWNMMAWRSSAATASLMLLCIFKTHAVQIMEVQVPSTVEVPSPTWLLLCFLLVSLF